MSYDRSTNYINTQGRIAVNLTSRGYSAYEVWLNQGNDGTVEDYLESLKGGVSLELIDDVKVELKEDLEVFRENYIKDAFANINTFNVNDYGIYADGVNDVSVQMQNLVDSIPDGSTILIPSEKTQYIFNYSVDLRNRANITIEGLGGLCNIKNGIDSNISTFSCVDSDRISFENISIDVNRENQNADLYPQYLNNGFYIVNTSNISLKNIEMKNSIRELKLLDCTNVSIDGLSVDNVLIDGLSLDNCIGGTVKNVTIKNVLECNYVSSANGIEVEDGTRNMEFFNIHCENVRSAGFKIQTHTGVDIACHNILIDGLVVNNSELIFHTNNWNYDIKVKNVRGKNLSGHVMKFYEVTDIEVDNFKVQGSKGIMTTRVDDLIFKNGVMDIENGDQSGAPMYIQARHVNILYENISVISSQHAFVTLEAFEELENVVVRNCNISSRYNSPVWLSGNWNKLRFESCNIKVPSGNRRIILDSVGGVDFLNCNIISESTMAMSVRDGCKGINIAGGSISSAESAVLVGVQRNSTSPFESISIDNVSITCPQHSVHLKGLPVGQISNVKVANCILESNYGVFFEGSENVDTVNISNNLGKNTITKNDFAGTRLVESGNNFADTV